MCWSKCNISANHTNAHTFIKVGLWLIRYNEGKELSARICVRSIIKNSVLYIILTKWGFEKQ